MAARISLKDMPGQDPNFEVLSVAEVRRRYRLLDIKAQEIEFNEAEVPDVLKHLIPLAHVWGIGDDVLRDDMMAIADPGALKELKRAVRAVDRDFSAWLTSPKALAKITPAYLAFTNLRMLADAV